MNKLKLLILLIGTSFAFFGCKRDGPQDLGPTTPIDGRQKFVGDYDVYDTLGDWQYEMSITLYPGGSIDSLFIFNWNGNFDVYVQHDEQNYSNYMNFVGGFGITDYMGHHWALYREYDSLFMGQTIINDTLRLAYLKNNIAFYVQDGVPYFNQSYREFAVKRH